MPKAQPSEDPQRSLKWQARRQAIIDTSAQIFARRGYHATGVTELCVANNLGKGALYYYIGSKEQVLAAIHDRVMDEVMARRRPGGSGRWHRLGAVRDARPGTARCDHRYPDHVWVFLHEFPALTGERAEAFRGPTSRYERRVEAVFKPGRHRRVPAVDPRLPPSGWLGMHNYTYFWFKPVAPCRPAISRSRSRTSSCRASRPRPISHSATRRRVDRAPLGAE